MAEIIPIKGYRYNKTIVSDLASVITPPYDVIDEAAQNMYYDRSPHNIIRLEYGKTHDSGHSGGDRYSMASSYLAGWIADGVLKVESAPSLYIFRHSFLAGDEWKSRLGLLCGVKLEPYEKGVVLPHEETLPMHKADRLALMEACKANFSPIFGLYADSNMTLEEISSGLAQSDPEFTFDWDGDENFRLWVLNEGSLTNKICSALKELKIYIADGHHRYETALKYSQLHQDNPAAGNVLMCLANLYDPGLVILPTHRLLKNVMGFNAAGLISVLKEFFEIEKYYVDQGSLRDFLDLIGRHGKNTAGIRKDGVPDHSHAFGLYTGGGIAYLLVLNKDVDTRSFLPPGRSPSWRGLDVSLLQSMVLEKCLGIGDTERAGGHFLDYSRDEAFAMRQVDRGHHQAAFFMNPPLVEEVTAIALQGEKMPQKSTYFYPKVPTGLVINLL